MGIRVRKVDDFFGIWDSFNCDFINPEYLGIDVVDIVAYMRENPFPKSASYILDDMLGDVTQSSGALIVAGTKEQAEWVAELINKLI